MQIVSVEVNSGKYAEGPCILQTSGFSYCTGVALLFEQNGTNKAVLTHFYSTRTREHAKKLEELIHEHNLEGQKPLAIIAYTKQFFVASDRRNLNKLEGLLKKLFPADMEIQKMAYNPGSEHKTFSINLEIPAIRFCE